MNIAEAKESIRDTIQVYLKKDKEGKYMLPVVHQRPVYLLGPPGIGKTAIVEQLAEECGLLLVSYSMTHHTRQSALGLPYIVKKEYGGSTYSVSEYSMSEIIASIYDLMEESGQSEGILFLDEINCVSETLYPSMLQFLQFKTFGRHAVPAGWVIVTAGNPPEYNRQAREFDVVTLDRVKLMRVEADLAAWQGYAAKRRVHPAVAGYLELKADHFYRMELSASGREYVTARGWEDLSLMLRMYEEEGLAAAEELIAQYLHHEEIVKEFAAYYELYKKYEQDWHIAGLLHGEDGSAFCENAKKAPFDEKLLLSGLIIDRLETDMDAVLKETDALKKLRGSVSTEEEKASYNGRLSALRESSREAGRELSRGFMLAKEAFLEDSELLYFMTRMTMSDICSRYIALFGSEEYAQLSKRLMLGERGAKLREEILSLDLPS